MKEKSDADYREAFERDSYVLVPSLIAPATAAFLHSYISRQSEGIHHTSQEMGAAADYAQAGSDPVMEHILRGLEPRIATLTGLELFPTYSFFRLYRRGSSLVPHRDRDACEISLSLHLGHSGDSEPWPLWIEGRQGATAAVLDPGDGILYRGIECKHWREEFRGAEYSQVFLHYVDRNGPYCDQKFDRRESLNVLG